MLSLTRVPTTCCCLKKTRMRSILCISAFLVITLGRCSGASLPALITSPVRISSSASGDSLLPVVSSDGRFLFFLAAPGIWARTMGSADRFRFLERIFRTARLFWSLPMLPVGAFPRIVAA